MTDYQHRDLAHLARRVSALVANLHRLVTFADCDLTTAISEDLYKAERAVEALIDDVHERMMNGWAEKEPRQNTAVPDGLQVARYDVNGQLV